MKQIINHFTDNDLYTFTCMYYIIQTYPRAEVEYTFFDRNGTVYPQGFDKLLQEQVDYMKNVVIQEDEIEFMLKKCYYLPKWFIDVFLRGFRFNTDEVSINQDLDGHLHVSVKGKWYSAIIWEMPILSCVSELFHILNGDDQKYDLALEIQKVRKKTIEIFGNGLILGDMGTRRRFSFDHQKMVLTQMKDVYENGKFSGTFTGTSNVWFAKE
ncbi:MAG: nicotinate phosphoribosyltransferase, partial [Bacteroidales bacterium]|nr:nicotinate phosphoribosyltransferase [Bacteroidales bacterium]